MEWVNRFWTSKDVSVTARRGHTLCCAGNHPQDPARWDATAADGATWWIAIGGCVAGGGVARRPDKRGNGSDGANWS